jgi:hypothetical protein
MADCHPVDEKTAPNSAEANNVSVSVAAAPGGDGMKPARKTKADNPLDDDHWAAPHTIC